MERLKVFFQSRTISEQFLDVIAIIAHLGLLDIKKLLVVEQLGVELLVRVLFRHDGLLAAGADGKSSAERQRKLSGSASASRIFATNIARIELMEMAGEKRREKLIQLFVRSISISIVPSYLLMLFVSLLRM